MKMKTSLRSLRSLRLLLPAFVLALALPALAQSPVTPRIYPLTNSTTFTLASSGTNVLTQGTVLINSQPFPVWRGRGFVLNTSFIGTNTTTSNMTFTLQFATPHSLSGTLTTNWNTAGKLSKTVALNSTTRVFGYTIILPTEVDNCTLGRLWTVATDATNTVALDPTNTFISVIP